MAFEDDFPIMDKLTADERTELLAAAMPREVKKGTVIHNGSADCVGLLVVRSGQLRAFIISDEGKEVTLYRLLERDICLFSASCMLSSIQFEISIEAEQDTKLWIIPPEVYKRLMERSVYVSNYTNQLMASRFSEVMWLMEQIIWKSFDKRLAAFLMEESALEGGDCLKITHERIAAHLGTAREVVTRMLRYFQSEGLVTLSRGSVELISTERLGELAQ